MLPLYHVSYTVGGGGALSSDMPRANTRHGRVCALPSDHAATTRDVRQSAVGHSKAPVALRVKARVNIDPLTPVLAFSPLLMAPARES